MDIKNLLILVSATIYLYLGVFIYLHGRKKLENIVYGFIVLSVLYWSVGMFVYRSATSVETSLLWCKILYVAPLFIVGSFLLFSYVFTEKRLRKNKFSYYVFFLISLSIASSDLFTNSIINEIIINPEEEKTIVFGSLYPFYVVWISGIFIWGYLKLLKSFKESKGKIKVEVLYIFWGSFLSSSLGMITNLLLPSFGIFTYNWAGQIFTVIMVGFIAYAIIAHRLMDIKFVMRRYSVYSVSVGLVIALVIMARYYLSLLYPVYINILDFLLLFVAIIIFPFFKKATYKIANKYFFSSLYDGGKVIAVISERLQSTLDLDQIYDYVYKSLDGSMHIKSFGILSYNDELKEFTTDYNKNFKIGEKIVFTANDYLQETFIKNSKPIIIPEFKLSYYNRYTKEAIDMFEAIGVEIVCSLVVKNRVVGLMLFGPKESGDLFNEDDLQVMSITSAQSAIAIENAMLFEETKNFSVKMENEVKRATADLIAANDRLMKLDEAKSEFISIASHQLRTPLTVIKGYISMILEGSFGSFSDIVKDSLNKVYASNERLINLVENLLNISRIESGNLKFNYETVKIEGIIRNAYDELIESAKTKGIELELKMPKKKLPEITIDADKIRQVVLNLIDNAIKYTGKGRVVIAVSANKNKLMFCVSDKGIGIKKEDAPNLFKKFSRSDDAKLEYTEGTGLGLFVAKQLVDAHKGRIWVESKGDKRGSKFCFELPMD